MHGEEKNGFIFLPQGIPAAGFSAVATRKSSPLPSEMFIKSSIDCCMQVQDPISAGGREQITRHYTRTTTQGSSRQRVPRQLMQLQLGRSPTTWE